MRTKRNKSSGIIRPWAPTPTISFPPPQRGGGRRIAAAPDVGYMPPLDFGRIHLYEVIPRRRPFISLPARPSHIFGNRLPAGLITRSKVHGAPASPAGQNGEMCIQQKLMIAADLFANRFGVSWSEGWMHNIRSYPAHEPGVVPQEETHERDMSPPPLQSILKGDLSVKELEIKRVPFMGTDLVAARDADGQIWAGAKWMCNGIGLSKNQTDNQIQKLQTEKVLKKGCGKFPAGVFDPNNETVAVKLDFVPLWLAKISITPTMEQETPELAETLEQYQLRAKDVLAAAFFPSYAQRPMTTYQEQSIGIQKAKLLSQIASGYDGTYKQILHAYATKELTGEFLLPLPALERKTYSATEIGEYLGISAHRVGTLTNTNGLKTDEYGKWFVDKSAHSRKEVQSFRYYDNIIPVLQGLI